MSDSVGKVSLDVELGGDLNKQLGGVAKQTGASFSHALKSSFQSVMKGLKATKPVIIPTPKVDAKGAEIDQLTSELDNVNAKIENQKNIIASLKQEYNNLGAASARELESLNSQFEATIARAEANRAKVRELKESLAAAVTPQRKNKLHEEIAKTENVIARLGSQADVLLGKIEKLESGTGAEGLKQKILGAETQLIKLNQQATKTTDKINALKASMDGSGASASKQAGNLNRMNKILGTSGKQFKAAAKGAGVAGTAFLAAGRKANNMGNQFTAAFKRIAKQVLVFAVIYKAIRGLQDYMSSSLRTNDEYVRSLNAIKTNLAVAFQPIFNSVLPAINAFMRGLAKVTAYIAAFISSLFGKTYKQSFEAAKGLQNAKKAMEGYGKAAKKAAGQLQGFDEINQLDLQDNEAGAGGGAAEEGWQMEAPDMDISGIQAKMDELTAGMKETFDTAWQGVKDGWDWLVSTFGPSFAKAWESISPELEKWKDTFKKTFDDIVILGEPLKNWWNDHVIPLWQRGIEIAGKIIAGVMESLRIVFESFRDSVMPIIMWFVEKGLPILTDFLNGAVTIFYNLFVLVKKIFDDIWSGVVDPVMKLITKIIVESLDTLKELWDEWGVKILEGIAESLEKLKELWTNLWEGFLKPFVDNMLNMLTWLWDKHLKGLIQEIGNFIGKLVSAAIDILNKFIMPIVNFLVDILGPIFEVIFSFIGDVIGTALAVVIDVAKGIIKALGGIIDFIAGIFTLDWKRAWEGIKTFFSGIGDALVGIFKGAVNLIVDALNFLIRSANKISIDIPDWVPGELGGKRFGLSIPEIPKLAKGGLAYGPTLAMVGDNRGASIDPEVVSPLSKLQDMLGASNQGVIEVLLLILSALEQRNNNTNSNEAVLQIDGTTIARLLRPYLDQEQQRVGSSLFIQST